MAEKPSYFIYYIQNDLGETSSHPNAVRMPARGGLPITLQDVLNIFPLKGSSSFHFRFQITQEKQVMYLDLINPDDIVPLVGGNVIAKILRLDTVKCASRINNTVTLKPSAVNSARRPSARAVSSGAAALPVPTAPVQLFMPTMKSDQPLHVVPKEIDGDEYIKDSGEVADIYQNLKRVDERGMKPVKQIEESGPVVVPDEVDEDLADKSDYVKAKTMARRLELKKLQEQRVAEMESNAADAAREEQEKDAAKLEHEGRIKAWALDHEKVKDIRVLLSTLQNVLWEDSGWVPMGMGDLIQPAKVRKAFLKASAKVHPDKQNTMSPSQKYIATQIFHYLESGFRTMQEQS